MGRGVGAVTADAPGTGATIAPAATAAATRSCPGSEMPGVPASAIKEMLAPSASALSSRPVVRALLVQICVCSLSIRLCK